MRYYKMILNTTAEKIEANSKVRLRDYAYDSPIGAVNVFMQKEMRNGVTFIAYRAEEGEKVFAGFSYDEKNEKFESAYSYTMELLGDTFCITKLKEDPVEITMFEYLDCVMEAKRRELGFHISSYGLIQAANLWIYEYDGGNKDLHYDFEEKIVDENDKNTCCLYDSKFLEELSNIENHKNTTNFNGNMVHYVISGRSKEACLDMTESLVRQLLRANRIKSRRIEIITNIEPELYKGTNKIETMIENNYGGTIVFDLREKFGFDATDYLMVCKYIENLIKQYKNECLFVFTYDMENTGFSYHLLPELKKYVIPVLLREGIGDRRMATKYLKALIKESEHTMDEQQAGEFLKQYPGNSFTQTDILQAYDQFETWYLNKYVLQAYNYDVSDDFMLDRNENTESSYDKLQNMIGLDSVKRQIDDIIATNVVEKERRNRQKNKYRSGTMHMVFGGNPGTAKTTVAKLFAGIAKEKGILKSGAFVEKGGMDLDGFAKHAIREAFVAAKGGVLFIDEAYSLRSDAAVTVLIQEMENHREDVIVVLAGYNERMQKFMKINEGLKSRIPYWIDFPDYDTNELTEIFSMMVKEKGMKITEEAIKEASYIFDKKRLQDNFGNGRYARNLMEHAIQKQSVRLLKQRKLAEDIRKKELFLITKDDIATLDEGLLAERTPGTAKKELDEMVGLTKVKEVIGKAMANFKLKKLCMEKGILKEKASLHMVFTGNPGTAKTTVARLFSEIMKDEKVLSSGKFVEVGRADLVGAVVGSTAPLVKEKFREAQGGVLFIDEAYSLCDPYKGGYGDEAINTIVQEMENHRDNVIVIFAGYPTQMKEFLDRNPGLLSRIAFQVEFEDYTVDELCAIAKLMLSRKEMVITDAAMNKLKTHFESVMGSEDYGNGRFVRKILEEAEMNLAERVLQLSEEERTTAVLTTIEESDIPERKDAEKKRTIGFAV